ncbi:MAG: ATP-binding protein, partial [Clostridia bacterium]|nr:ATP-binding protein [Clostridia bacterium]
KYRIRIEQVFINIIDNAIKYTPAGGAINVDVVPEEGCISVRIVDTGAGIPADKLDRVKEKFFKANSTVRGSGIGLAVADEIIKHHNGLLLIDSTEGVGTTVTVVLPTVKRPQADVSDIDILRLADVSEEKI